MYRLITQPCIRIPTLSPPFEHSDILKTIPCTVRNLTRSPFQHLLRNQGALPLKDPSASVYRKETFDIMRTRVLDHVSCQGLTH